jgi:hypothetical protein
LLSDSISFASFLSVSSAKKSSPNEINSPFSYCVQINKTKVSEKWPV